MCIYYALLTVLLLPVIISQQVWVRVLKMCGWHSKKSVRKDGFSHTTHEVYMSIVITLVISAPPLAAAYQYKYED